MGYLICDECAGYYQLQEGEYPEDFSSCQCGGHLEYVEEIEKQNIDVVEKPETFAGIFQTLPIRRITGILSGALIMFLPYLMFSADPYSAAFVYNSNLPFLIWGAGGFTAALIAGGNLKSSASNGFYSAFISGLFIIIYYFWIITNPFTSPILADNLALFGALCVVYMLVPSICSMLGGLIIGVFRKFMT